MEQEGSKKFIWGNTWILLIVAASFGYGEYVKKMIRLSLGEEAQALENAGKSRDIGYIIGHHEEFMKAYEDLKEPISRVFALLDDDGADTSDKPLADATLLSTVYEELDKAADSMDCDALQAIFDDMDGYRIPEVE